MSGGSRDERPPAPDPLPLPVVDDHVHLDIPAAARDAWPDHGSAAGDPELPDLLEWAAAVGVPRAVQIGCDLPSARRTVELVERHPQLLGGVALHPNEAPRLAAGPGGRSALDAAYAQIERLAAHPRIRVVGETGLDSYRTGPDGALVQQESFRWHIDLAKRLDRTLQIHDRDAHEDVLRILDEEGAPPRTVFHCFSGDVAMARRCVDAGYVLSFSGTVTFKNADGLRDALATVPLDQLQVETDAPYLAPVPYRGRVNASYLVPHTVRVMAQVLGVEVAVLCAQLAVTAERLYGSWDPPDVSG
ncbi:MAG: TatD family hydrolase [Angustibacter sp.]